MSFFLGLCLNFLTIMLLVVRFGHGFIAFDAHVHLFRIFVLDPRFVCIFVSNIRHVECINSVKTKKAIQLNIEKYGV